MDVPRGEVAPVQIVKLVEHEQRMIAGAAELAVLGSAVLIAVGRADARIHVEHDHLRAMSLMHPVDLLPAELSQCGEVLVGGQKLRLEAPHLAGGCRSLRHGASRPRSSASPDRVPDGRRRSRPLSHRGVRRRADGAAFSGFSATIASVVMRSAAIEAAPCSARRTTLVGSMMPAFTMST